VGKKIQYYISYKFVEGIQRQNKGTDAVFYAEKA
jgi:hypothetical protein